MAALVSQNTPPAEPVVEADVVVEESTEQIVDDILNLYTGIFKIDGAVHEVEFTAESFVQASEKAIAWTNHPSNSDYVLHGIIYIDAAQWEMSLP